MMATDLERAAVIVEAFAELNYKEGYPNTAKEYQRIADDLRQRHDHDDPCDDTSCPCRAAEHDHMIDMGYGKP